MGTFFTKVKPFLGISLFGAISWMVARSLGYSGTQASLWAGFCVGALVAGFLLRCKFVDKASVADGIQNAPESGSGLKVWFEQNYQPLLVIIAAMGVLGLGIWFWCMLPIPFPKDIFIVLVGWWVFHVVAKLADEFAAAPFRAPLSRKYSEKLNSLIETKPTLNVSLLILLTLFLFCPLGIMGFVVAFGWLIAFVIDVLLLIIFLGFNLLMKAAVNGLDATLGGAVFGGMICSWLYSSQKEFFLPLIGSLFIGGIMGWMIWEVRRFRTRRFGTPFVVCVGGDEW